MEYFDGLGMIFLFEDMEVFKEFVDFEKCMLWYKEYMFKGYFFVYVKQINVKWNIMDVFFNGGDMDKVFLFEQELKDIYYYNGNMYGVCQVIGVGIYLCYVWGDMVFVFYVDFKENYMVYVYIWVYLFKDQEVGLWVEFQNYSCLEMDLVLLFDKWDYKGSCIWINDCEILFFVWIVMYKVKSYEVFLGNENCVGRVLLVVYLNKGWNKVFLKLFIGKFKMVEMCFVKWMFIVVFVIFDGERVVEGLIYLLDK